MILKSCIWLLGCLVYFVFILLLLFLLMFVCLFVFYTLYGCEKFQFQWSHNLKQIIFTILTFPGGSVCNLIQNKQWQAIKARFNMKWVRKQTILEGIWLQPSLLDSWFTCWMLLSWQNADEVQWDCGRIFNNSAHVQDEKVKLMNSYTNTWFFANAKLTQLLSSVCII